MSAPVDVLAVMEREARVADAYRRESGADVLAADAAQEATEARAAVAELIEANVELAAANADPAHTLGRDLRVLTAEKRLSAILARVGGAA